MDWQFALSFYEKKCTNPKITCCQHCWKPDKKLFCFGAGDNDGDDDYNDDDYNDDGFKVLHPLTAFCFLWHTDTAISQKPSKLSKNNSFPPIQSFSQFSKSLNRLKKNAPTRYHLPRLDQLGWLSGLVSRPMPAVQVYTNSSSSSVVADTQISWWESTVLPVNH